MVTVRDATSDDLDALMALRAEVAAEGRWIGAELPLDEEGDRASLVTAVEDPDATLFVADADGVIVGQLFIRDDAVQGILRLLQAMS